MKKWYIATGNNSDVVLSSKIVLSRNLLDTPFPIRMSPEIKKSTNKKIFATLKNTEFAGELNLVEMSEISNSKALSFYETGLISRKFLNTKNNSNLILSNDESISIMLCEEDHIKLQVMRAGQNLENAFSVADKIDDQLSSHLSVAFDKNLGFLTSSPTELGTGLKASLILHLPALTIENQISRLGAMVNKLGLSLRYAFGDAKTSESFFVLSNQITLGISEKSAIDNLNAICNQIIKQERSARENLKKIDDYEDTAFRAMGTLKMARKLSVEEFMNLISTLRLGVSLGYYDVSYETIGKLIFKMQSGSLSTDANAELSEEMCEKLRAKLVRESLE